MSDVFAAQRCHEVTTFLQIRPAPGIAVHVHFFTTDEIEMDFAREELQGQPQLDVLCGFLRAIVRGLGRPVILTPENGAEIPLIGYDPEADQVVAIAAH